MKKIASLIAVALVAAMPNIAVAQDKAPAVAVQAGKMVYANGQRLGAVYRVKPDGSPQVMVSGKLVTVPVATITVDEDGKVLSTMTKAAIMTQR